MLNNAEKAEVLRLGMIVGHFETQDAINWADLVIASEDKPANAILEVSMAGDVGSAKMVSLLKDAAGEQGPGKPRDVFFGILAKKLAAAPSAGLAEEIANQLKTLRSAYDAPDAAMNKAGNLAGPFGGDPEAATKDVRAFLSEYERFGDSWSL
ncbi:MAG: hypothetical protein U1E65_18870 [Myxococcota bacterium]